MVGTIKIPSSMVTSNVVRNINSIIGKYVNDLNTNEKKMIVNNHGKVFFEQINLFEGMRVEYSDEVVF